MTDTQSDHPKVRLGEISYDRQEGRFEARVDVERFGITFRYPCAIRAPQEMAAEMVRHHLMVRALKMSDTARRAMTHIH